MSYKTNIDGLTKLSYEPDGTGSSNAAQRFPGLAGDGTQNCSGVTCPGPDSGEQTFSVPVDPINFFHGGDYFRVGMNIRGPALRGAECKPPSGPTDSPCQILAGEAYYDGLVTPGGWATADGLTWTLAAVTFDADNTDDNTIPASTDWPHVFPNQHDVASLINPSPVWPAVDAEGNEYGGLHLFTLAQLPATIDVFISFWSYHQETLGRMTVAVTVYMEGDVDIAAEDDLHIIGTA